ncbi:MAG TPA: solute carrier family 23 protein [Haploplasma sp.]|nr:solute carrier family 23 protein [Haploplasma sp.]
MNKNEMVGYLPDDKPTLGKSVVFALQQFLVMLPATILAALIMNSGGLELYSIPAAVVASGVATLVFLFMTKGKIPLYYGSSFSYIPAVSIIVTYYLELGQEPNTKAVFGAIMIASIVSGLMSIGAGLIIKKMGIDKIEKILPGHITGMIAMIIGLTLAGSTMDGILAMNNSKVNWYSVLVALITFVTIALLTVKLKKGFISQVPILIGLGVGIFASYLIYVPSLGNSSYFGNIGNYLTNITKAEVGLFDHLPWYTIPQALKDPSLILTAVLAIFPIAFATIPESAAHVEQLDLYVNNLANELNDKREYKISELLDENLIGDGTADIVAVLCGGPAGTNYGENVSASTITKNFSSHVFKLTGVLAILIGILLYLLGNLNISEVITEPVIKGVSLYLFGAIAVQGIALMIDKQVDVFNPKIVAVMAFIAIVGLGVDKIPITNKIIFPGIGVAAFGGIILNLLLDIKFKKKTNNNIKE